MLQLKKLLIGLIVLFSAGCAGKQEHLPTPPAILNLPECPSPHTPDLPELVKGQYPSLEKPINIQILLERDDIMRFYIKGLEATVDCYQRRPTNGSK